MGFFISNPKPNPKAAYVVGTDGRHLYSANSFALPLKHSIVIPTHKFLGWSEFNSDGEWQMKADTENVQISSRRWRFVSKQIDGAYPNWRQVVPEPAGAPNLRNVWSLFNAFTESLKDGNLTELPKRTEALHGLLDTHVGMALR